MMFVSAGFPQRSTRTPTHGRSCTRAKFSYPFTRQGSINIQDDRSEFDRREGIDIAMIELAKELGWTYWLLGVATPIGLMLIGVISEGLIHRYYDNKICRK